MILKFKIDLADAFRKGIDLQSEVVSLDVDPSNLDERMRNLIADRLAEGNYVCVAYVSGVDGQKCFGLSDQSYPDLVEARTADLEGLLEAVKNDEARFQQELQLKQEAKRERQQRAEARKLNKK